MLSGVSLLIIAIASRLNRENSAGFCADYYDASIFMIFKIVSEKSTKKLMRKVSR